MKTIRCRSVVNEKHQVTVQLPEDISPGEHFLVVTIEESLEEFSDDALLAASSSSLDFWDNPIDDEVWNDA